MEGAFHNGGGPSGQVWSTLTDLDGAVYSYVITMSLNAPYQMLPSQVTFNAFVFSLSTYPYPSQLGYTSTDNLVAFESNTTSTVVPFGINQPLQLSPCGLYNFQLYTVAPVLGNGWALLGEPDKWVSVSAARFRDLSYDGSSVYSHHVLVIDLS